MTTTSAETTDLIENATVNEDQDRTSTPGTMTQAILVPTADNMNMEHIFFSIKHLAARITQLEQKNAQMEDNGITPTRLQELGLMTRAEHDQEIRRLWNTIHTTQSAHQGLNAQFEKVTTTLAAFNRQIEESQAIHSTMQTMLTSLRGLVDQSRSDSVPNNWRSM